jgi:adenosylmethionine-8-amino-7-oxononanoate aminotransferase
LNRLHLAGLRGRVADTSVRLAERLSGLSPDPGGACWFVSSGSEAVEVAIKISKAHHRAGGRKPHAYKVVSRWGAYHGVLGTALEATWTHAARLPYEPGPPGVSRVPAPWSYRWPLEGEYEARGRICANYLEQHIIEEGPETVAAFIAEPVMQFNGAQPPPPDYFPLIRDVCTKYDVLFIADEVITGFGRTGEWFGVNHWDVKPDLIACAKGVTAGYLPLAAVITTQSVFDALPTLYGGHTHAGSPPAAAAALAVADIYERDGLVQRSKAVGAEMLERLRALEELDRVGQVRGLGMWAAIDFTSDKATQALPEPSLVNRVARRTQELGAIVSPIGTSVEVAPSLNIEASDLDAGLTRLETAVKELASAAA